MAGKYSPLTEAATPLGLGGEKPLPPCAAAAPSLARSRLWAHALFLCFGMGSSWMMINIIYLELAAYEHDMGILVTNRVSMGYQVGTLLVPGFLLARKALQAAGRKVDYPAVIMALYVVQLLNILAAAFCMHSLETVIAVSFVAGGCGYLAGVVHQSYLALNCEDIFCGTFWAGDAACGGLTALIALLQQPQKGPGRWGWSPGTMYLLVVPIVLGAWAAFIYIDRQAVGALPRREALAVEEGLEKEAENIPEPGLRAFAWLLPAGVSAKPGFTIVLLLLGFWSSFSCWGIGDSLIPYACKAASPGDGGESCTFYSNLGTVVAAVLGTNCSSLLERPSLGLLCPAYGVYTLVFFLFCMAAWGGEAWTRPWSLLTSNEASPEAAGFYVVGIVLFFRGIHGFTAVGRQRLIQVSYPAADVESMNLFFYAATVAANLSGVLLITPLLIG